MHGISAIIVTWNSRNEIIACLRSLIRSLGSIAHEIIVVDNCSGDHTCTIISRHFPSVRLIAKRTNTGFGAANNAGLSRVRYEYVLLVNPDTVVNSRAIGMLWSFLQKRPDVGVVGPEQVNAAGRFLFTASKLSVIGVITYILETIFWRITGVRRIVYSSVLRVGQLNAGCIMARRNILGSTYRWFDPKIFLYGEELYFFPKVRARLWNIYFLRSAVIVHHRDRSINQFGGRMQTVLMSFRHFLRS